VSVQANTARGNAYILCNNIRGIHYLQKKSSLCDNGLCTLIQTVNLRYPEIQVSMKYATYQTGVFPPVIQKIQPNPDQTRVLGTVSMALVRKWWLLKETHTPSHTHTQ
jgi:hypothetical protein